MNVMYYMMYIQLVQQFDHDQFQLEHENYMYYMKNMLNAFQALLMMIE